MPTAAAQVRTLKVPEVESDEDPYRLLAAAIVARAWADAQGHVFAPGAQSRAQIQAEARAWLAAEHGVADLIELCGYDAEPVLRRVRQLVHTPQTPRGPADVSPDALGRKSGLFSDLSR